MKNIDDYQISTYRQKIGDRINGIGLLWRGCLAVVAVAGIVFITYVFWTAIQ